MYVLEIAMKTWVSKQGAFGIPIGLGAATTTEGCNAARTMLDDALLRVSRSSAGAGEGGILSGLLGAPDAHHGQGQMLYC